VCSSDLPASKPLGTSVSTSFLQHLKLDVMSLIQIGILALVALVLGLFVVRPILANSTELALPAPAALLGPDAASGMQKGTVHTGEIDDGMDGQFTPAPELTMAGRARSETEIAALENGAENPVDRLRAMIGERQEDTVEILRSWLEESEEKT